jgi:hypothetical protein
MANQCNNCGAELFAGQQFCRTCGKPTVSLSAGEMPTQTLRPGPQTGGGAPARTVPLSGAHTGEVYPGQGAPYPSVYVPGGPSAPTGAPPRKRSAKLWVALALFVCLIGVVCLAAIVWAIKSSQTAVVRKVQAPRRNAAASAPPAVGEDGAEVSDDKTVITKSYALAEGASVSLKNISGSISVEGWDEPRAEVKIIKHGGSAEERRRVPIREESSPTRLSLERPFGGGGDVEVEYEVKLPRTLKAIEINSMHSDVTLSDVRGAISIELKQGDIKLTKVYGAFSLKTIQGDTKVEVAELREGGESKIENIAGDISLHFDAQPNIELKAETLTGEIGVDNGLGLKVEKRMMGEHVAGRVGAGKHAVSLKAIKGDIRITD